MNINNGKITVEKVTGGYRATMEATLYNNPVYAYTGIFCIAWRNEADTAWVIGPYKYFGTGESFTPNESRFVTYSGNIASPQTRPLSEYVLIFANGIDQQSQPYGSSLKVDYTPDLVFRGCTNPAATNYDANATEDDGTCEFAVNTGMKAYATLEQYDTQTGQTTGLTKPNDEEDPDYIPPFLDETACPIGQ